MFLENNELYKLFGQSQDDTNKHSDDKLKEEFKADCNRLSKIAKEHLPLFKSAYKNLNKNVTHKEYSSGGELLTRGYYCPSPVIDIITGNLNRGKLLKRLTSLSKPTYEYCFDKDNKLILINYLHSDCTEILEYENNTVIGITFSTKTNEIVCVSECVYDDCDRIVLLVISHSSFNDCCMDEIHKETYAYNQQGLYTTVVYDYLDSDNCSTLNYDRYEFKHDEDGFLSEYSSYPSSLKDDTYKVYVKRKV